MRYEISENPGKTTVMLMKNNCKNTGAVKRSIIKNGTLPQEMLIKDDKPSTSEKANKIEIPVKPFTLNERSSIQSILARVTKIPARWHSLVKVGNIPAELLIKVNTPSIPTKSITSARIINIPVKLFILDKVNNPNIPIKLLINEEIGNFNISTEPTTLIKKSSV